MPAKGRTLSEIRQTRRDLKFAPQQFERRKVTAMTFQSTIVQKKLEDAGFNQKQAFGLAAVLEADVVADLEARFVTREYLDARLAELKAELKTDIGELKADLKIEIGGIKIEMIKWMAGMIGGSTLAIIIAVLRLAR